MSCAVLSESTRFAFLTAVTRVDSSGLPDAAVATGTFAIAAKLPGFDGVGRHRGAAGTELLPVAVADRGRRAAAGAAGRGGGGGRGGGAATAAAGGQETAQTAAAATANFRVRMRCLSKMDGHERSTPRGERMGHDPVTHAARLGSPKTDTDGRPFDAVKAAARRIEPRDSACRPDPGP